MDYSEYLETDYWKAVSAKVKERAGYRCQLCNSQHDLCAHHRTYEHRGKEMQHLSDLTCLCRRCHEMFHGIKRAPQRENVPKSPQKTVPPTIQKLPTVNAKRHAMHKKLLNIQKHIDDLRVHASRSDSADKAMAITRKILDLKKRCAELHRKIRESV